jgi:hypothetical protein
MPLKKTRPSAGIAAKCVRRETIGQGAKRQRHTSKIRCGALKIYTDVKEKAVSNDPETAFVITNMQI